MLQRSQTWGEEVNTAWEEGCPWIMDTKNAEFIGNKDNWQDSQDKEETNETNIVIVKLDPNG